MESYHESRNEFEGFLDQLHSSYAALPYSAGFVSMGRHLLDAADKAAARKGSDADMLAAYDKTGELEKLINEFSPYVTREIETASNGQLKKAASGVAQGVTRIAVMLAIALIALILCASLIARSIIHPLIELTQAVSSISVASADISAAALPPARRCCNEVSILVYAYRDMVERIQTQMNEIRKKQNMERLLLDEKEKKVEAEKQLVHSELRVYQSQINSHFLFNAFNMVSRLAYLENARRVQQAVNLIAQFLRDIIRQFDRNITVLEEFKIVENFTGIQDLRFGDRIVTEGVLEADAEWFVIPALTMQPLVENAYRHGLANKSKGYIRYYAQADESAVQLGVWDDGEGMSEEKIRAVKDYITRPDDPKCPKEEGIGLQNVYRRLSLLYPGCVDVILESEEGRYLLAGFSIRKPADKKA